MHKVAVLVGSLRKGSLNRSLGQALARLAAGSLEFCFIEIGDLPHYNDDLWPRPPAPVLRLKADIASCDAALFLTPEYNRGIPGVLKNAFDWGTRPWGQNSWAHMPCATGGTSPGGISTAVAQSQLRNTLVALELLPMGQPELYLQFTPGLFGDSDRVSDPAVEEFLSNWVKAFAAWIARYKKPS